MRVNEESIMGLNKNIKCIYNSSDFHKINQHKVNDVRLLEFSDKMNLVVGIDGSTIKIPYSAPFGFFEFIGKSVGHKDIDEGLDFLDEYVATKKAKKIFFRIPPKIYFPKYIDKTINSLFRHNYECRCCDLNYHIPILGMDAYNSSMKRNAKKNLKRALGSGFDFKKCENESEKRKAYEVIKENRNRKGYPLKMSWNQVMEMEDIANTDYFLLTHEKEFVASAVVFLVTDHIRQVVYWGDVGGFENMRPMNILSYRIVEYYNYEKMIDYLDIGPSTEEGIPNFGLCSFKESIGCELSNKYTFEKNFNS